MKKFLYMAVAAIAALSSCSDNDIDIIDGVPDPTTPTVEAPVFSASIEGSRTTIYSYETTEEGNTVTKNKVNWESTDEVSVNGIVYTVAPGDPATTATLTKKNSGDASPEPTFKAYYPASMYSAGTATLPASYTYAEGKFNMPMYAENSETTLGFKNICAVLAITVPSTQMTSVTSITVSSDKQMNGAFTATSEGVLTFADKTLEAADKKVTLTFSAAKAIANGSSETFYIAIPANTYNYLQIDVTDGTTTNNMRTKAGATISVERNKIYPFTFKGNLLKGVFSVSATKKVQFTKANLYWDGSAYQFEANQTAYPTAWNTSHVGLFFWSNYTDYTRTDEHAHEYKPYYSSFGASSKSTSDVFWCGEDHPLEVAGTQGLYVLSAEEWYYLTGMFTYASYSDVRNETNKFALAMVNGYKGLLIFPDGYNTELTSITGIATVNDDWDAAYPGESESIPDATWSAMEAAGVVFLPAAGYRGPTNGQTITPGYCYYWSSTPNSDYTERANGLNGTDAAQFTCPGTTKREYGSSIRLVKTVE